MPRAILALLFLSGCARYPLLSTGAEVAGPHDASEPAADAPNDMARRDGPTPHDGPTPLDGPSTGDSSGTPFLASGGTESIVTVGLVKWRLHAFTVDGTFTVSSSDGKTELEYLIVGGGAGPLLTSPFYLAGGGGGAVKVGKLKPGLGPHPVFVGQGGSQDQGGGASSAFAVVAGGGSAVSNGPGGGGTSGSGLLGGLSEGHGGSGGGGGAGGAGGNADWGNYWGDYYFWGGKGGAGVQSGITGTMLGYGGGGSGQGWHFNVNPTISKSGGPLIPGDFRALAADGGATALHCAAGGTLSSCSCVGETARANSGGGGADYPPRSGAAGVVIVRYPIQP